MNKKTVAWLLILIPAFYFLIYSIINFMSYYGFFAKVGAVLGIIGVIAWLIGDFLLASRKK